MTLLLLIAGMLLLTGGGEALIRGSVSLGRHMGLSPLAVGIVIIGFGTSMPELVVCVGAVLSGVADMAVGNVIGSNISNVLLILAAAALIKPIERPARVLLPDGVVVLSVSVLVVLLGLQGGIPFWQGVAMVALLLALLVAEYLRARRQARLEEMFEEPLPLERKVPHPPLLAALLALAGLALVLYGAELFVDGATRAARFMGVSDGLIGLTVVALGTSFPELATAMVAAARGHSDVAYGNVIGSNMFNLLGILGASAIAGPLAFPSIMVWLDGPVMIAATALMIMFVHSGARLSRLEAVVMLCFYGVYVGLRFGTAIA